MKNESLVRPRPIRGLRREEVVCLPCDLPSGLIQRTLEKRCSVRKDLRFCRLYLLPKRAVLFGALGAPAAVLALEPLVASGTQRIIFLGFSGSLSDRFSIGDLVSVGAAFSDEGTSKHYPPKKRLFLPADELKDRLEEMLSKRGIEFKTGKIVSTDAPYRETPSWLKKSRNRGAELVDMETSAVFALAGFYGLHAVSLQIVSDELGSEGWRSDFWGKRLIARVKTGFFPLIFNGQP